MHSCDCGPTLPLLQLLQVATPWKMDLTLVTDLIVHTGLVKANNSVSASGKSDISPLLHRQAYPEIMGSSVQLYW